MDATAVLQQPGQAVHVAVECTEEERRVAKLVGLLHAGAKLHEPLNHIQVPGIACAQKHGGAVLVPRIGPRTCHINQPLDHLNGGGERIIIGARVKERMDRQQ